MNRTIGTLHRGAALFLALLLLLSCGYGMAEEPRTDVPFLITVSWYDAAFQTHTAQAFPFQTSDYEDSYWVKVDADAPLDNLQLTDILDMSGAYQSFSPAPGTVLPPVQDAGESLDGWDQPVEIMAKTASGQPGALIYLYVSTVTASPQMPFSPSDEPIVGPSDDPFPVQPAQPVQVTVHYVDEQGRQIAPPTYQTLGEGTHTLFPEAQSLPDNYSLSGAEFVNVTVDAFGANPGDVYFSYAYHAPAPVVGSLRVQFLEVSSNRLLHAYEAPVTFGQMNDLYADLAMLPEGYRAVSDTWLQIMVDEFGRPNVEPVFYFISTATPVPTEPPFVPQPVLVQVNYLSIDDNIAVALGARVTCNPGETTAIFENPINLLPDYQLVSEPVISVTVDAMGNPDRTEVNFLYQYVAPKPSIPESRDIPVRYFTLDMRPIASETRFTCYPGENIVTPAPLDLPDDYELSGEGTKSVTLDENGLSVSEVFFLYRQVQRPTAEPIAVRVQYLSWEGEQVADEQRVLCVYGGETRVQARPVNLLADYVLDSEETVTVSTGDFGALPNPVIFRYRYSPNIPAPKVAFVPIKYLRPDGERVFFTDNATCFENEENAITVDLGRAESGYVLASEPTVYVTVDSNGVATPAEVVFRFSNEVTAYVIVYYQDQNGQNIAAPRQEICYVGTNTIDEQHPIDLPGGYVLQGPSYQQVQLSSDGVLTPSALIFRYTSPATPTALPVTPTPFPYEYAPRDGYCVPKSDTVNFRSEPSTAHQESVLFTVSRNDTAKILGTVRNFQNETWFHVILNNTEGYLKESVVRVLSDAEVAVYLGYTPAPTSPPTAAPTSAPTVPPDGAPIDRWSRTNAGGLNFRREPKSNAKVILQLKKGDQVWVYSSQTVNNEKWYFVHYNGTDGYLMAKFLDLLTPWESEQLQRSNPMPTQTPLPTSVPTNPPTNPPTQPPYYPPTDTPAPTHTPEPTAAPYRGYAATRWMVDMRSSASDYDEVLRTLPADSLVFVNWQVAGEGGQWSFVLDQRSNTSGYLRHDALRPLSQEEAERYMAALRPSVTETPVPTPILGYAMTLGDGVPMRAFPDTNGEILQLLPYRAVAHVTGQMYDGNTGWHRVQYNGDWGFIRLDQLRILSREEEEAFLRAQEYTAPVPSQAPTYAPITAESLSALGHVNSSSGRVNLREKPTTASNSLRLLSNYALATVLGSVEAEDGLWYLVNQDGTEGYISARYFKVLTLGELPAFLASDAYQASVQESVSGGLDTSYNNLQAMEDYNRRQWQNPALTASYAPFTSPAPTRDPERLPTQVPTQSPTTPPAWSLGYTATKTPTEPPRFAPIGPQGGQNMLPVEETRQGGSPLPWVLLALAAVGGGAAIYAYSIHRKNEQRRRQALRAQQMRQARTPQRPQPAKPAYYPEQGSRTYPAPPSSYMPPRGAAPRPPVQESMQQTGRYPRPAAPASSVQPTTNPYRPVTRQQMDAYRASLEARARDARGETQRFDPLRELPPVSGSTQQPQRPRRSDRYQSPSDTDSSSQA